MSQLAEPIATNWLQLDRLLWYSITVSLTMHSKSLRGMSGGTLLNMLSDAFALVFLESGKRVFGACSRIQPYKLL